jgi:hypothetical protein
MDLLRVLSKLPRGRADGQVQSFASVQLPDFSLPVGSGEQLCGLRRGAVEACAIVLWNTTTLPPSDTGR